jgi:hypothetical protein
MKHPRIPAGYRLLKRGETVRKWDLAHGDWDEERVWFPVDSTIGRRVWSKKGMLYMGCGDWVAVIRSVEETPEVKFALTKEPKRGKQYTLKGKWTLEPASNMPAVVGPSLLPTVSSRPKGKKIPLGWVKVKDSETRLRESMYTRPCWWIGDSEWEPLPKWWAGVILDDVGDWIVIRKMTKKELAIANTARWSKRARELKRTHRADRARMLMSYLT